jgi:hypothetical protein
VLHLTRLARGAGRDERCHSSLAKRAIEGMATSCPPIDKVSEAEKFLKAKGRKKGFSKNEAENILK